MYDVCLSAHISEFKFIFGCALFSLWQYLCLSRQRLCNKSKTLPSRGLPRAQCQCPRVINVFSKFFKNSDNFVETDRTSEKFFYGSLNSRKVTMTVCMRWRVTYSFKAPSANAPVATTQRLASTSLVSGFHPIPFRENSSNHSDSGQKEEFARLKPQLKLSPEPLEDSGAANEWLSLAVRRGQALRLLRPRGFGARLDCFTSLSPTARCCSRPRALESD
jgi:hypothetical protein